LGSVSTGERCGGCCDRVGSSAQWRICAGGGAREDHDHATHAAPYSQYVGRGSAVTNGTAGKEETNFAKKSWADLLEEEEEHGSWGRVDLSEPCTYEKPPCIDNKTNHIIKQLPSGYIL
jgi:hypothetical protein